MLVYEIIHVGKTENTMSVTLSIHNYAPLELFEMRNPGVDGLPSLIKDNVGQGNLWNKITVKTNLFIVAFIESSKDQKQKRSILTWMHNIYIYLV